MHIVCDLGRPSRQPERRPAEMAIVRFECQTLVTSNVSGADAPVGLALARTIAQAAQPNAAIMVARGLRRRMAAPR